jgi:hypothetical protein
VELSIQFFAVTANYLVAISSQLTQSQPEAELLYDWRFTDNQFVLATSPLRLTTSNFIFQLKTCGCIPYVIPSDERMRLLFTISEPKENTSFNGSCIVVGVFTDPLPRHGRLLIRLLHSNGCACYNIIRPLHNLTVGRRGLDNI